jgi:outer membrane protein assembly factor BamB
MGMSLSISRGYLTSHEKWGSAKPMIVQHTRLLARRKFPLVVRTMAKGAIDRGSGIESVLYLSCQDNKLLILTPNLDIIQEIVFPQWVRSIAIGDLNGDGSSDLVLGLGDKTLRILRWKESGYEEVFQHHFENFVNTVAVADVDGDGHPEVVAGSWDKSIVVLDGQEFKVKWTQKYPAEVDKIKIFDINRDGKLEIMAIFRGGILKTIEGSTGKDIWTYQDEKDLQALDVGVLDPKAEPYIITGGNSQKLLIFTGSGLKIHDVNIDEAIYTAVIGNIDGAEQNKVVISTQKNRIRILGLAGSDIITLEQKWNIRSSGAVNEILLTDLNGDEKSEIIYGGYDCAINVIQDFFYGELHEIVEPELILEKKGGSTDESVRSPSTSTSSSTNSVPDKPSDESVRLDDEKTKL